MGLGGPRWVRQPSEPWVSPDGGNRHTPRVEGPPDPSPPGARGTNTQEWSPGPGPSPQTLSSASVLRAVRGRPRAGRARGGETAQLMLEG